MHTSDPPIVERLRAMAAELIGMADDVSLIIHPPPEVVDLSSATYAVDETAGTVTVAVNRTRPRANLGVEVGLIITPLTAQAGVHYVDLSPDTDSVDVPAGASSGTKAITIVDVDLGAGASRTFRVSIVPSATGAYSMGSVTDAVVTINGVGGVSDGGALQFTVSSYDIPESAGTDTTTVQIARQGTTGTPPAASVTVTSTNGTAVAPTDFTAVSTTVNWGVGDVANKNVPVTVVDNPGVQGDKTFSLAMSSPSGTILGAVSAANVTILDLTSLPAGSWPLRAIYKIGAPQDYSSTAARESIALNDFCILSYLPARGIGQYQTDIGAILALNSGIRPYIYRNWSREPQGGASVWPVLVPHLEAGTGVPGLAQAPNEWFFQNAAGTQITHVSPLRLLYQFSNCVDDANGLNCAEYLADFMADVCVSIGISAVGIFWDDYRPFRLDGGVCVRNADNINRAYNELTSQQLWRQGQIAGMNRWRVRSATRRAMANTAVWSTAQLNGVAQPTGTIDADFKSINLDGGMFETPANPAQWKFGRYVSGANVLNSASGSFALGLEWVRHGSHAPSQFRLNPPDIVWTVFSMTDANLAGSGKTEGRKFGRLCMAYCYVLTDHYLDMRPIGYDGNSQEWDEYYGENVPSTFASRFAKRRWMGLATEVSQGAPRNQGCYWREWENAMIVFNPTGNGTKTVTLPSPGAGKEWRFISGSQDAAVNTGAATGATIVLPESDARVLKRVTL